MTNDVTNVIKLDYVVSTVSMMPWENRHVYHFNIFEKHIITLHCGNAHSPRAQSVIRQQIAFVNCRKVHTSKFPEWRSLQKGRRPLEVGSHISDDLFIFEATSARTTPEFIRSWPGRGLLAFRDEEDLPIHRHLGIERGGCSVKGEASSEGAIFLYKGRTVHR